MPPFPPGARRRSSWSAHRLPGTRPLPQGERLALALGLILLVLGVPALWTVGIILAASAAGRTGTERLPGDPARAR
ncbi:hypothetical protein ACFORO_11790 [Amycolatopsis halotolerans]|uniref:Uncharacterized protein n=1 Tax=Amycolatopsis halotolerans TaxID=330083 RepID=A0ABV7QDN7_9PSEU